MDPQADQNSGLPIQLQLHVSPNCEDFSFYCKYNKQQDVKAFGNNSVKGAGKGDIDADIEYRGKSTRI